MKRNRLLSILLVIVMIVMFTAGCSNQAQPTSDEQKTEGTAEVTQEATEPSNDDTAPAQKKVIAGVFIRSLTNPYEIELTKGAQMFADFYNAKGANIEIQILPCESSDEKQINDLKAFVTKKDANTDVIVFMITNTDPLMAEVAEICEDAQVNWASLWNIPDGMHPQDYKYWVAHTGLDDYTTGKTTAEYLFASLDTPNEGNVLALQGMLAVTSATKRFEGLQDVLAENPGIKLLDQQTANWSASEAMALTETWLSKYSDVDAIWCANDDMAIGAVQALTAKGLNGKVKVCGADGTPDASAAVQAGDMVCTMNNNPYVQCGYMLTYCYKALTGEIKTDEMTPEERYFNTPGAFWTSENIDDELSKTVELNFDDLSYCYESAK